MNLSQQRLANARATLINSLGTDIVSPPLLHELWFLIEAYLDVPFYWLLISHSLRQDTAFQNYLWSLIEASKTIHPDIKKDKEIVTAATNAATILNAIRTPFTGRNLKGVRIPEADLSYSVLDGTDLQNADCQNVIFQNAWLANANFTGAKMQRANFREWPYIQFNARAECCCFSPDGYWTVVANDKTISLLETATQTQVKWQ